MVMKGNLTWAGDHTIQNIDDILRNHTPETHIILLTNVTPINSIKNNIKIGHTEVIGKKQSPLWSGPSSPTLQM